MDRIRRVLALGTAAALLLAACGSDDDDTMAAPVADAARDDAGAAEAPGDFGGRGESDGDAAGGGDAVAAEESPAASTGAAAGDEALGSQQSVGLQAGSVDDNEEWEAYLRYREAFAALGIRVDDLDVSGRRILTVTDADGRPLLDAVLEIEAGDRTTTLRTGADGRAVYLAPTGDTDDQQSGPSITATVRHGDATTTTDIGNEPRQTIVLAVSYTHLTLPTIYSV